jgi:lipopolysaccharide export system protein LptA
MKHATSPLLALVLAALAHPAQALDSDAKQPIYIESDSAVHDDARGETIYAGNVKTVQGSLEVYADHMTVYQKNGKTDKIIATGNPVRLKQTPEGGREDMHGTSQRADFFPDTSILILLDNATVWQGDKKDSSDRVSSDRIEYDTRKSLMRAGSAGSGGKRVHVTLQPSGDKPKTSPP